MSVIRLLPTILTPFFFETFKHKNAYDLKATTQGKIDREVGCKKINEDNLKHKNAYYYYYLHNLLLFRDPLQLKDLETISGWAFV